MKRTYISPEFEYTKVDGTYSMKEQRSFFGSKMLEVEDLIEIKSQDIIYNQSTTKEQFNLNTELLLPSIIYSPLDDKNVNHTIRFDDTQSNFDSINFSKWIIDIKVQDILKNYIFSRLKESRVFNGIESEKTKLKNIDLSIYEYINLNILDRYQLKDVKLYLTYNSLLEDGNYQSIVSGHTNTVSDTFVASNGNIWDENGNIETKTQSKRIDDNKLEVKFTTTEKRSLYNFGYYYDLYFEKI
jgi:hypothetical protein